MADSVKINPDVLREVAQQHDTVADQIADARRAGENIHAAVQTYGPIMHQVKAAVGDCWLSVTRRCWPTTSNTARPPMCCAVTPMRLSTLRPKTHGTSRFDRRVGAAAEQTVFHRVDTRRPGVCAGGCTRAHSGRSGGTGSDAPTRP